MPRKAKDTTTGDAGQVLTDEQVKAEARAYADRVLKRARKSEAYPDDLWFTSYVRRWRSLSGLKAHTTHGPVTEPGNVVPLRRRRSA